MQAEVAKLDRDWSRATVDARPYQQRLDGMVFGDNPRDGYFADSRFYHPELAFSLDFPAGWKTQNQREAVVGVSAAEDAIMQLTLSSVADPADAVAKFIAQEGVEGGRVETETRNGLRMSTARFEVARDQNSLSGRVLAVRDGERTFQVLGYGLKDKWSNYSSIVDGALGSYRRVTDRAVLNVQPKRLSMVDIQRGLTLQEFQRSYPSTVPLQTLGLLNRLDAGGRLPAANLAKRVVGGPGT
jgi:predicted Zn-dependent protease